MLAHQKELQLGSNDLWWMSISSSQHVECGQSSQAYLSNLGIASEAMGILQNRHRRGAAVANLQHCPPLGKASTCGGNDANF